MEAAPERKLCCLAADSRGRRAAAGAELSLQQRNMNLEQHLGFVLFIFFLFLQIVGTSVFDGLVHACLFGVLHVAGYR